MITLPIDHPNENITGNLTVVIIQQLDTWPYMLTDEINKGIKELLR